MVATHLYAPLGSNEQGGSPKPSTSVTWTGILTARRLRHALIAVALIVLGLIITHTGSLSQHYDKIASTASTAGERLKSGFHHTLPSPSQAETNGFAAAAFEDGATDAVPIPTNVRWSDYAYTQYVTNTHYLCNSVMIFESLHRLGSKADRVMLYPEQWTAAESDEVDAGFEGKLLAQARDRYSVKLVPIAVQSSKGQEPTWADSFTKLLAFNQTQYKRIINVDSDGTIRKPMDELFFLPPAPVAMPRAFWLHDKGDNFLSSQLIVIQPSEPEWQRIEAAIAHHGPNDFDMEIVNDLYGSSCIILPHRRYDLLTCEFRAESHASYLGSEHEEWNADAVLAEAKFVHFSDWPYPKPWLKASASETERSTPKCNDGSGGEQCKNGEAWLELYKEFSDRRQRVCGRPYDNIRNGRRSAIVQPRRPPSKYEPMYA